MIFGCEGLRLSPAEKRFFRAVRPFGFILFSRNIDSADQIRALCDDLRGCVDHDAPILLDQEGGRVQRLRPPLARDWLPPLAHVRQAGENAARAMYLRSRITAAEMRALGIDCNCAPLVDVAVDSTAEFLKNRCYGVDAQEVSRIGRATAKGLMDGGVLPVVKHIPGHGRATQDSHLALPVVTAGRDDLTRDFAPFKALKDLPMAMTAHVVYQALDAAPATTSPVMIDLIRNEIGFEGLLMTDDLSMRALHGPMHARARASLRAGCDVILHCNGEMAEMRAIAEAAGDMTQPAQTRAQMVLAAGRVPQPVDIAALTSELESLL